jgi:polysaccharide export outer membrane protein
MRTLTLTSILLAALSSICIAQIAPGDARPAPASDDTPPSRLTITAKPASSDQGDSSATPAANLQPLGPNDFSVATRQNSSAQQEPVTPTPVAPPPTGSTNTPPASASSQSPGWQPLLPPKPANAAANSSSINNSGQGAANSAQPSAPGSNASAPAGTLPGSIASSTAATANAGPAGTTTSTTTNQPLAGATGSAPSNLLIGKGDLIEVDVYAAPDFDRNIRVDGNGNATLPMIGPVKVEGLTASEAEKVIAKKLSDGEFFNNPQVTVFIKEYVTQGITVMGEVQHPGIYPVLGPRTLFDAISLAGGTTPKAGNTVTVTRRSAPRSPTTLKLGNGGGNSMESNVDVFPGDTVVVAAAGIVYVVGAVRTPGGYIMDNGKMTLLQALAMAQGATPTASLNRAKLVRKTATGQQEMPLALNNIVSGKQSDLPLQADDIVFVPNSAAKSGMRRGLEAAVQAATGVAIYHPY